MTTSIEALIRSVPRPRPTGRCACGADTYGRQTICAECEERLGHERKVRSLWADRCPPRYRDARFDSSTLRERVHDARAVDAVKGALTHRRAVVLLGPSGVGKTTLAAATAAEWCETQSRRGCFAAAMALATARADSRLGGTPEIVADAIRAHVTLIDDLGNEPQTATSSIVEVVFARHDEERATIVTSGLGRLAIATRYGAGFARRLFEQGMTVEMAFLTGKK